jgi:PAS domain S-box-containing protein
MSQTGVAQQAGVAVRASPEALLKAVVETSDDAIFTCDASTRITSWGATAVRLFGSVEADVLDQPVERLFAEHLRQDVHLVTERVLAGDRIRQFDSEVLRADGMPMPVSLSMCPVLDDQGSCVALVLIVRDVTEQRLAQATLAEVEGRLQEGEAVAHIGSWLWDVRTGAVQWSAEFYRIHGVDPLDFDGTIESYLAAIHPADRGRVGAEMEASVADGRPFEADYRVVRSDQQVRAIRVRAQLATGSDGTAMGLRGIGQDVTEGAQA